MSNYVLDMYRKAYPYASNLQVIERIEAVIYYIECNTNEACPDLGYITEAKLAREIIKAEIEGGIPVDI